MVEQVKSLSAMQEPPETWVWSLGQEDSLQKEMATHSNILAWKIPWTEELGRLQYMGLQRVRHDWARGIMNIYTYLDVYFHIYIYLYICTFIYILYFTKNISLAKWE